MNEILFEFSGRPVTVLETAIAGGLFLLTLIVWLVLKTMRQIRQRADADSAATEQIHELESHLSQLLKSQGEMTGRMQTMAEVFGSRQSDMMRAVNERLDGMGHKLGISMADTTKKTQDGLRHLHERLAVIDRAQQTITDLSGQVGQLQSILSNKQTRGAFGQGRMEAIIQDQMAPSTYSFQATLSNNNRPDCLIHMPNGAPSLAIDAKFPLEGFNLLRKAETEEQLKYAQAQFRRDFSKHIQDIGEKYLLPGETQDTAFLFVPSESVFAELNEGFEDLVQKAHRTRVVIVSPSLLMLSIQVIQSVLRDAKMREQAHLIQAEVGHLIADVSRLNDRVGKLQSHFTQANKDIDQILISTDKITKRSRKIEDLELGEIEAAKETQEPDEPRLAITPNS
ncbi:DNA recombination protein RmuC [Labrenzia sp. EL_208]|nr:DNA recombination protein RmuC [Roseibium album]MBG6154724.1 DNA recombination protein RmuC [Labrenzia sp. EL_162]MBG6176241.1 DNA recombination protein RmuC [Labrenzia sp. EL_132]MBG6193146.1 DNA recombination protein RmuC [Labrenzia sp. EL_159]MBG6231291.1 DNA recombination protein RmuC [Labrenzia sp. EL_208]